MTKLGFDIVFTIYLIIGSLKEPKNGKWKSNSNLVQSASSGNLHPESCSLKNLFTKKKKFLMLTKTFCRTI